MSTSLERCLPAARAAVVLLVAALALSGCGGSDKTTPRPPSTPAAPTVRIKPTVEHVTGRLKPKARRAITARVGKLVDAWYDAAYVGGDYPRPASGFTHAFPGFTPGAAAQARQSLDLMSNAGIGSKIDGVTPITKGVKLDVLAVKGWPVGVTARVWLSFRTHGSLVSRQLVRGQLDLAKIDKDWKVFAFTITKTRRPLAGATPSSGAGESPTPSQGATS